MYVCVGERDWIVDLILVLLMRLKTLGVGMKYKIHNRLNIGCEFSFRKLFGDKLEGDETLDNPYHIDSGLFKNKDWYSLLLLTVTWDFGRRSQPCNNRYSNGMY